jgi:hypothetical protein
VLRTSGTETGTGTIAETPGSFAVERAVIGITETVTGQAGLALPTVPGAFTGEPDLLRVRGPGPEPSPGLELVTIQRAKLRITVGCPIVEAGILGSVAVLGPHPINHPAGDRVVHRDTIVALGIDGTRWHQEGGGDSETDK